MLKKSYSSGVRFLFSNTNNGLPVKLHSKHVTIYYIGTYNLSQSGWMGQLSVKNYLYHSKRNSLKNIILEANFCTLCQSRSQLN